MEPHKSTTIVVDVGGRYGMHPSWSGFAGELLYLTFEPDPEEAQRLRKYNSRSGFEVVELALAKAEGERDFYITKHRGYCSFYPPNLDSEWFKRYRPGEGEIESVIRVKTSSLDSWASSRNIDIDFLKIDTEGSELEILEGAEKQISSNVLGLRVELLFEEIYKNVPLFPEIFNHLKARDFFLINFDYFGRGVPRHALFRNPNPLVPDNDRYGTLIGTDGVWLRKYDWVRDRYKGESLELATLKYAYFCILNSATDVALDTLMSFVGTHNFSPATVETKIYRALRRICTEYLGRYRVNPEDVQWNAARSTLKEIFNVELEAGNKYWELIQNL
ncbi:MAG: FkbM family methyltransferase [Microcoleus sp. PH2017_10_PVI_O_A]|uniref:FkbM family methyltransferase n=1 Tax=unclassified Microcoleus TaxID=2642155 RepID=UPI001D1EFD3B|nr:MULTISPECIES: FkbM family methyltransferase [unclassified Microcoleus]TAE80550.1 MAG: FkbM family methyltransferase [Oscillatoriales cyanobacterium]MCC3405804.1 FkbM family methyltransferase [Microcoleus sp. PH2017_10_PVI_O_A]MCC3459890.1 FkbM family methyltransferase [Microcoleus sp. PH2017_11_PCY_U_A]MCC3478310.1 FkbM family methyltransferase [Microcoleus sp. PH2017_12_PCY_D_A]MCC3559257.1 FkbM family methyltransferase [Microcoleus sp. PH2017_27_LUM_O_A]